MLQLFNVSRFQLSELFTVYAFFEKINIHLKSHKIKYDGIVQSRFSSIYTLLLLVLCGSTPNLVFAQKVSNGLPENASMNRYGDGWICDEGYRESKGACAAIKVPANAFPTNKSYGQGWECNRGFKESDNNCYKIKVPKNGYLDYTGIRVKCNRGYIMDNKSCKLIKVPANGYLELSAYGPGWTCERGFRADNDACVALKVPKNAHIGYSGKVWECDNPYIKKNNDCIMPVIIKKN